jgi:hypothetical protein
LKEFEKINYNENAWNCYPTIYPPKIGLYMVKVKKLFNDPFLAFYNWDPKSREKWEGVIAFREIPK